jgi:tRNA-binding protein
MYRLFYNEEVNGDILFILLASEKKPSRIEKKGDVAAIYEGQELIGYNLFNAKSHYAFPSAGIIYAPSSAMIEAVNKALTGAGFAPLPFEKKSGYAVAKITALEEHPLDEKAQIVTLSLGEKKLTTVSWYPNLAVNDLVVVALDGTILKDGSVFHSFVSRNIPNEASLVGAKELGLPAGIGAYHPSDLAEGSDFFYRG